MELCTSTCRMPNRTVRTRLEGHALDVRTPALTVLSAWPRNPACCGSVWLFDFPCKKIVQLTAD